VKIAGITDPVTAIGLRLAGVRRAYEVENSAEAGELFDSLIKNEEIGIIIISERIAQDIRWKLDRFLEERRGVRPVVVEIPDKVGPIPERMETVRKLVRRAIGVEVLR